MLGDSGPSFVVGYGKEYPEYAQDMGASCPGFPFTGRAQVLPPLPTSHCSNTGDTAVGCASLSHIVPPRSPFG